MTIGRQTIGKELVYFLSAKLPWGQGNTMNDDEAGLTTSRSVVEVRGTYLASAADDPLFGVQTEHWLDDTCCWATLSDRYRYCRMHPMRTTRIYIAGNLPVHAARISVEIGAHRSWDIYISMSSGEVVGRVARAVAGGVPDLAAHVAEAVRVPAAVRGLVVLQPLEGVLQGLLRRRAATPVADG